MTGESIALSSMLVGLTGIIIAVGVAKKIRAVESRVQKLEKLQDEKDRGEIATD